MPDEQIINIRIEDVRYTLRPARLTPLDARECRTQVGRSFAGILKEAQDDPDIDTIAAIVWLARRQAGERKLSYVDVAKQITYESTIETDEVEPSTDDGEVFSDPELSATE